MEKLFPDISHYHPVDNWKLVKENVSCLISKASQGTSYIDPTLYDFIEGCEKYEIDYWVYAYLNKGNEVAQAKFLVNVCKNLVGQHFIGYALDAEADNPEINVTAALEWLKTQGYPTMLYIGWSDLDMYRKLVANLGNAQWWEARYGINNGVYNPKYPCHDGVNLHQFTSEGICPGIPGTVDLNRVVVRTDVIMPVPSPEGRAYTGTLPVFADGRDCYKRGDGIVRLVNYPTQIKRVQKLLKWVTGKPLDIDGKYGAKTEEACRQAQEIVGARADGIFGQQTLRMCKAYRK